MPLELGHQTPMVAEDEKKASDPLNEEGDKYKQYSPPLLLRRVLKEELTPQDIHKNHKNNKLLVAAVHAALLDSGFVRSSNSHTSVHDVLQQLGFSEYGSVSGISYFYTLPQILAQNNNNNNCNLKQEGLGFALKFEYLPQQKKEQHVKIIGSLISKGLGFWDKHKEVCLRVDENKYAPAFEFFWKNSMWNTTVTCLGLHERRVCELWRMVKDEIALPLMIDLCEVAGLPAPPCFMSLPFEIKMKILNAMPGDEVAKLGRVYKELLDLASDNEL